MLAYFHASVKQYSTLHNVNGLGEFLLFSPSSKLVSLHRFKTVAISNSSFIN